MNNPITLEEICMRTAAALKHTAADDNFKVSTAREDVDRLIKLEADHGNRYVDIDLYKLDEPVDFNNLKHYYRNLGFRISSVHEHYAGRTSNYLRIAW